MPLRPAVFLDRDGTLNRPVVREGKPYPPANVAEFRLLPDAAASCARLKGAGFTLVIATNQPDVARGTQRKDIIEAMHKHLMDLIPEVDRIETCYAPGRGMPDPEDYRRKPAPGMLADAAAALGLDLAHSWMVGDRASDIEAGHAAGCRTVLIDWGYQEPHARTPPDFTVTTLAEAVNIIIAHQRPEDFE